VPDPIDSSTTLLTVHSDLAEKIGLATVAPSAEAFASEHITNYHIVASLEPSAGDKIIGVLGSAAVRGILLVIFLQALYIAFSSPGHGRRRGDRGGGAGDAAGRAAAHRLRAVV